MMRGLSHGVTAGDGYLKNDNLGYRAQGHKAIRRDFQKHTTRGKIRSGPVYLRGIERGSNDGFCNT